jgi:putative ABC transport system permease protein
MSVQKNRFISIANRLISSLVPHKYLEEFIGDLDEMHEERKTSRGLFVANLFYWIDTLHLLFGFSSLHFLRNQQNPTIMLRHYVTISFRTIQRSRFSSIITIFGLAAGMGVCLLIFQYVHFETTFDTFHENSEYQYRLIQHDFRNGNDIGTSAYTTYALGERCLENIPEVNHFLRIKPMESSLVVANVERNIIFKEDRIWYTDANFLDFFDFPVLFGDKDNCLQEKHGVVITQSLATKYFGEANPVGKNLKISGGPYTGNFEVTAVLHDIPTNSHLQFDILINIGFYFDHWTSYQGDGGWVNSDFITYLSVDENADKFIIKDKINNVVEKYASEKLAFKEIQRKISLQPLTDIHLHSSFLTDEFTSNNGNIQDVRIVILIGIFIMLMAWVNYINLSTARALERSKEVGIRKSIG